MTRRSLSLFPARRDGRRLYGVRDTDAQPSYASLPRRRCGHLACGTYCSLSPLPLTDRGPLRRAHDPIPPTGEEPPSKHQGSASRHLCGGRCAALYGGMVEKPRVRFHDERELETELDTLSLRFRDLPLLRPEELREKLRENPLYLMQEVCKGTTDHQREIKAATALQKLDRYSRGIVRATVLARVLRCFGAHPPMPEISELLRYCILTKDGYVVYKPLIIRVYPEKVPGYQDNVRDHLSPPEVWDKDIYAPACPKQSWHPFRSEALPTPHEEPDVSGNSLDGVVAKRLEEATTQESSVDWSVEKTPPWKFDVLRDPLANTQLTPAKSDAIRRIFAMWDRCLINDDTLKLHIKMLGIPITREADYLIATHSGTRDVSFGKFLHALQIEDLTTGRRNRSVAPYLAGQLDMPPPSRFSARRLFEAKDNPISWRCRVHEPVERTDVGYGSLHWTSDRHRVPDAEVRLDCGHPAPPPTNTELLHQLLIDAEAGVLHPLVLRGYLDRLGLTITPEIDALLNEQELVGSVPYHKLAVQLRRAAKGNACRVCRELSCEPEARMRSL